MWQETWTGWFKYSVFFHGLKCIRILIKEKNKTSKWGIYVNYSKDKNERKIECEIERRGGRRFLQGSRSPSAGLGCSSVAEHRLSTHEGELQLLVPHTKEEICNKENAKLWWFVSVLSASWGPEPWAQEFNGQPRQFSEIPSHKMEMNSTSKKSRVQILYSYINVRWVGQLVVKPNWMYDGKTLPKYLS